MIRAYKTEAIVIKRRNLGEADRILTVFTRESGKITVKASGVRRVPSRRSAHVELLNCAVLTLYMGSRFPVLTEATATETFQDIKSDLRRIGFAYHICELIDGLCPENQEQRSIYFLLKRTLRALSECGADEAEDMGSGHSLAMIIHSFEVDLLTELGYWRREVDDTKNADTHLFIENILERRLKSKRIFQKFR